MMRRLLVTCGVVLAVGLFAAPKASADSFTLNNINCDCLPAGTASAGTVNINDDGATLTFTVTLIPLLNFHYTNAFDLFAFSYSGAGTLSLVGGTTTSPNNWTLEHSDNNIKMDGAGQSFDYGIVCPSCSAVGGVSGVSVLTFTIQSSGGPLSIANVTVLDGNNNEFAAAVTQLVANGCTGVVSGFSNPDPSSGANSRVSCGATVPDGGATAGLLGLGMLGLAYLRRRLA